MFGHRYLWLLIIAAMALLSAASIHVDAARPQTTTSLSHPSGTNPWQRELLDRYCVTCHNERLRTAGLALDVLEVTTVGESPDIWENVVRSQVIGCSVWPGGYQE